MTIAIIPNYDHSPPREHPDCFKQTAARFLAS
jgi:pimeloyl-ACP methyl ester carboxylesterase